MREYVNDLVRRNGIPGAFKIALRCQKESNPLVWTSLNPDIFHAKTTTPDKFNNHKINMSVTYNFWTHVVGILNKNYK